MAMRVMTRGARARYNRRMPDPTQPRIAGLPPVLDPDVRILILGSLPGEASLAAKQYYAHPRNQFWRLVGDALGIALAGLPYERRLETLLQNGVGLWDVISDAHRSGSLDSSIRNPLGNDLAGLVLSLPRLRTIAFNGGTAARIGMKALGGQAGQYRTIALPSSSPALTLPYPEKLLAWRQLLEN